MIARIRKWLGNSINLSLTWGELLLIVLLVILVNAFWPGVPAWAFFAIGAVVGFARPFGRDIRRWLRRRRTT
jgi:hypothetical protein